MNAKQILGTSLALAFSALVMACASEGVDDVVEAAGGSVTEGELTTDATETNASGDDAVAAVYCQPEETYKWSGCQTKSFYSAKIDRKCVGLGYRISRINEYTRLACPVGKVYSVKFQCCD